MSAIAPGNTSRETIAELEAAILSAVILEQERLPEVRGVLGPDDFGGVPHRILFRAICEVSDAGSGLDILTIRSHLEVTGRLDKVGGGPFLSRIIDSTPAIANVLDHAREVRAHAERRLSLESMKRAVIELESGEEPKSVLARVSDSWARLQERQEPAGQGPSVDEPLRGLRHLGPIAVLGAERLKSLAAEPIDYAWDDIAVQGTVTVLAGKPGGGKTTALFLILAARASHEERFFLGRAVRPASDGKYIVLIEGEHSEGSAARKLLRSARIIGVEPEALGRVILVARKAVRLGSPEWGDVVRLVSAGLVADIALDTLARVAPANADNEAEQVAIFDCIAQAIEAGPDGAKPNVWVVAHSRKSGEGESLDEVSGSAQRVGQADTVIILTASRDGGRVVSTKAVFAKLREEPEDYPLPVSFSLEGDELSLDAPPGEDKRPLEEQILDLLKDGPKTKYKLRTATRRNDEQVEKAITNLFGARSIVSTDIEVRGKTQKAFQLRETQW